MISIDSFNILNYEVLVRKHALIRAFERGVTSSMVEATIKGGEIERFGKNNLRFMKKYKRFTVVCVDHLTGEQIIIATIETKEHKK